jgi:hypothetical protein
MKLDSRLRRNDKDSAQRVPHPKRVVEQASVGWVHGSPCRVLGRLHLDENEQPEPRQILIPGLYFSTMSQFAGASSNLSEWASTAARLNHA